MPRQRYTHTAVRAAKNLAEWISLTSSQTGRVDWERSTKERLTRGELNSLETQLKLWLQVNFGVEGSLIHWAADPALTTAGVMQHLNLFARLGSLSLAAANILRQAGDVIRQGGWAQGTLGGVGRGFDTVGAVAAVCERDRIDVSMRVSIIQALLDRVLATTQGFSAVSEWNDHPSRTPQDVLRLLSTCADDMETI